MVTGNTLQALPLLRLSLSLISLSLLVSLSTPSYSAILSTHDKRFNKNTGGGRGQALWKISIFDSVCSMEGFPKLKSMTNSAENNLNGCDIQEYQQSFKPIFQIIEIFRLFKYKPVCSLKYYLNIFRSEIMCQINIDEHIGYIALIVYCFQILKYPQLVNFLFSNLVNLFDKT